MDTVGRRVVVGILVDGNIDGVLLGKFLGTREGKRVGDLVREEDGKRDGALLNKFIGEGDGLVGAVEGIDGPVGSVHWGGLVGTH